jgi:hypothetical protein
MMGEIIWSFTRDILRYEVLNSSIVDSHLPEITAPCTRFSIFSSATTMSCNHHVLYDHAIYHDMNAGK